MVQKAQTTNATFMGIDNADLSHIFGLLRRHTYSTPQLVVPQELLCNGRDSHRDAGTAIKPLDVHLPQSGDINPQLIVRDYGTGMSEETVREVYTMYGKSTKRGQKRTTGMFGIGAKSPWALEYCDEFFVDSYYNGTLSKYRLFIDETEIGALECTEKSDTTEPNGVRVTVGISQDDISAIHTNFGRITNFWGVRPNVKNGEFYWKDDSNLIAERDEWVLYESGYGKCIEYGPVIVVDDIPYPLSLDQLSLTETERNFMDDSIYLICDRDFVAPAANREQLQYNEMTIKNLKEMIKTTMADFKQYLRTEIEDSENLMDARFRWYHQRKVSKYNKIFSEDEEIFYDGIKVNIGEKVKLTGRDGSDFAYPKGMKIIEAEESYSYKTGKDYVKRDDDVFNMRWDKKRKIILVEKGKTFPKKIVTQFLEDSGKTTNFTLLYLGDTPTKGMKYLEEKINLSKLNYVTLSDLKEKYGTVKRTKKSKGGPIRYAAIGNGMWEENTDTVDNLAGYYIVSKNKSLDIDGEYKGFNDISSDVRKWREFTGVTKVYAFPQRLLKEVNLNPALKPFVPFVIKKEKGINVSDLEDKLSGARTDYNSAESKASYFWTSRKDKLFQKYLIDVIGENHLISRWIVRSEEVLGMRAQLSQRENMLINYVRSHAISLKRAVKNSRKTDGKLKAMYRQIQKKYDGEKPRSMDTWELRNPSKENVLAISREILGADIVRKRVGKEKKEE